MPPHIPTDMPKFCRAQRHDEFGGQAVDVVGAAEIGYGQEIGGEYDEIDHRERHRADCGSAFEERRQPHHGKGKDDGYRER